MTGSYMESVWRIIPNADTLPPKRLVIVLSENEKGRIMKKFMELLECDFRSETNIVF